MLKVAQLTVIAAALLSGMAPLAARNPPEPASHRPDVRFYQVAFSFEPESVDSNGVAIGSGFSRPNRWGQYTAYLMKTDAGMRTWRIEHYLPTVGAGIAQGSTMYLLEGHARALLIDTANPAVSVPGVNDLKTVVRYLLGHDDAGRPKPLSLDFVVANTHSHGDHIGENRQMSDRAVYYMDGDWPADAPGNYVPIREGGGKTTHGKGVAAAEIDLGGRVLKAIAMPPHTPGSTGYLDARSRMLFSGDALGSAWPFLQAGDLTVYDRSIHHVDEVTSAYPDLLVMPAHFYQTRAIYRSKPPLSGRPLDRAYILDQAALADSILAGTTVAVPFGLQHNIVWSRAASAGIVYSLDRLAAPGEPLQTAYHAMRIGPGYERGWAVTRLPPSQDVVRLSDVRSEIYLLRERDRQSVYLIVGSDAALLIGTGSGSPGLAATIERLAGSRSLDVALLDGGSAQVGGLAQLRPRKIYVSDGMTGGVSLADGETIALGRDGAGNPLRIEAQGLHMGAHSGLTLRVTGDRLMFVGSALGTPVPVDAPNPVTHPLVIRDPARYQAALTDWSARTLGRYDSLYVTNGTSWYLSPDYVAELQQALTRANNGRGAAVATAAPDGTAIIRSRGTNDVRAIIAVPKANVAK